MDKTIEFTQVVDRCCGLDVHKKVIVATAHELLTIVYHVLKNQVVYYELGCRYVDQRRK